MFPNAKRIAAIFVILACTQLPAFFAQYTQALGGSVIESRILYADLETRAALRGLSVEDYIAHHERSDDPLFKDTGAALASAVTRYQSNALALGELRDASPWTRPFIFAYRFDPNIVRSMGFTPAIPLSTEGLAYAVVAWLLCWIVGRTTRQTKRAQVTVKASDRRS
ncbi:MAG: DUF2937 family protein [Chlamydiia bacterium]|nr:DUF2937 family protein [Chlamydiia bacterium]